MKRSHFILLCFALLAIACDKNVFEREWKSIPEGAYLDISEMKKVLVVDSLPTGDIHAIVDISPEIKERIRTYEADSRKGKEDSLTISCQGEAITKVKIWKKFMSYSPMGLSITLNVCDFESDRLYCWLDSHEEHSAFNLLLKQLKKKKIPVTYLDGIK